VTTEIETMLKDMAQELLEFKPTPLKRLGLDEIASKGNYCAVDLDKSKLVAILQNGQEKLPKL